MNRICARPMLNDQGEVLIDEKYCITFVTMDEQKKRYNVPMALIDTGKPVVTVSVDGVEIDLLTSADDILQLEKDLEERQPIESLDTVEFRWDDSAIKLFFAEYKIKKSLLDKKKFLNVKAMYGAIAESMNSFGLPVSSAQVENKYQVLAKTMKNYIQRSEKRNSSGRGRKALPYEKEMLEMFGKRHNMVPNVLLGQRGLQTREELLHAAGIDSPETNKENLFKQDSTSVEDNTNSNSGLSAIASTSNSMETVTKNGVLATIPSINNCNNGNGSRKRKREGRTAVCLTALNETISDQTKEIEAEHDRRAKQQEKILEVLREHIVEQKRTNDLAERASREQEEKNCSLNKLKF